MSSHSASSELSLSEAQALVERLVGREAPALARCITIMEGGGALAELLYRHIHHLAGRAIVVGFTGPPGVGKSTLVDSFIGILRRHGHSVAVAAVDPSSPISGGAILGDRVRMQRYSDDSEVFIRSIASRGHLGGLSENIHRVVDLMDVAGFEFILVETVGIGQSEIEIIDVADVCVLVGAPNLGDDVQAIKAGVLEVADVLVVNKADLPLASRTTRQLKSMLKLREDKKNVPIIETIATRDEGINILKSAIDSLIARSVGERQRKRVTRMQRLIAQLAGRMVQEKVLRSSSDEVDVLAKAALTGEMDLSTAVRRALKMVL